MFDFVEEVLADLEYISAYPTGSYYICDPPVRNTDKDIIILVDNLDGFIDRAEIKGYDLTGDYDDDRKFISLRRGNINLIVTKNKAHYMRFVAATLLAKKLNLTKKKHRIELFDCITNYNNLNWE